MEEELQKGSTFNNESSNPFAEEYYDEGDLLFAMSPEDVMWPAKVTKIIDNYVAYEVAFIKHKATDKLKLKQTEAFTPASLKKYQDLLKKNEYTRNTAKKE